MLTKADVTGHRHEDEKGSTGNIHTRHEVETKREKCFFTQKSQINTTSCPGLRGQGRRVSFYFLVHIAWRDVTKNCSTTHSLYHRHKALLPHPRFAAQTSLRRAQCSPCSTVLQIQRYCNNKVSDIRLSFHSQQFDRKPSTNTCPGNHLIVFCV